MLGGGLRAMGRASRGVIEEGSGAASRAREPERETFSESQTEEPLWILFSTSDVVAIRTLDWRPSSHSQSYTKLLR